MLGKNKNNREILPWLYNLPALTIIILVLLVPIISTVVISLTNMSIYNWKAYDFTGLGNYKNALNVLDSGFLEALVITVIWTIITMVIQLLIAFVIALGLNSKYLLGKTFFKTLLMFPCAMPAYIGILLWRMGMFNNEFGFFNQILKSIGLSPISYLSDPVSAFISCLAVNLWLALPYMIMMMDGAINSIDSSLYESAAMDGANYWIVRFKITVPLIKKIFMPSVVMTTFVTFKQFDTVYLMTMQRGSVTGAGVHTLITYVYENAFITNAYGYSGAISVLVFVIIILVFAFMQITMLRGSRDD